MDNAWRARHIIDSLSLERPPVAVAFVDQPPAGVPPASAVAPSACTYWRLAEQSTFFAPADFHLECPIGAMTMGFPLPDDRQAGAQQLVGFMAELGYFDPAEVAHLPAVQKPHDAIVYGPLEAFALEPDLVIVIASPRQAMVLAEAVDAVKLSPNPPPLMGRPACAAVAWTANEQLPVLSLGCIGARTYVEIPDDRVIMVVPGASLDRLADRLATMSSANQTLAEFHGGRKMAAAPVG